MVNDKDYYYQIMTTLNEASQMGLNLTTCLQKESPILQVWDEFLI
jgi:hypothetical protein